MRINERFRTFNTMIFHFSGIVLWNYGAALRKWWTNTKKKYRWNECEGVHVSRLVDVLKLKDWNENQTLHFSCRGHVHSMLTTCLYIKYILLHINTVMYIHTFMKENKVDTYWARKCIRFVPSEEEILILAKRSCSAGAKSTRSCWAESIRNFASSDHVTSRKTWRIIN